MIFEGFHAEASQRSSKSMTDRTDFSKITLFSKEDVRLLLSWG